MKKRTPLFRVELKYFSSIQNNLLKTNFTDSGVIIDFAIPSDDFDSVKTAILDLSAGKCNIERLDNRYEVYKK